METLKFRPLTFSKCRYLRKYFQNQQYRLCAYSLPSIFVWSEKGRQAYWTLFEDMAVFGYKFLKQEEKSYLHLPLSLSGIDCPPEKLFKIAKALSIERYLFIPESYIVKFGLSRIGSLFSIKEDKVYEDYVYLQKDLAELKGRKFSKKRNLIHQFEKNFLKKDRIKFEKITYKNISECCDFLKKWSQNRPSDKDEFFQYEKKAALNALHCIENFDFKTLLIRIDGIISAFAIAAHLTNDMAALHFQKAFSDIKGLYQYFDNICAKLLFDRYEYVNKESDMDIFALAKAKRSYYPVMKVKSYILSLL